MYRATVTTTGNQRRTTGLGARLHRSHCAHLTGDIIGRGVHISVNQRWRPSFQPAFGGHRNERQRPTNCNRWAMLSANQTVVQEVISLAAQNFYESVAFGCVPLD